MFFDPRQERYEKCAVKLSPGELEWVTSRAWPGKQSLCKDGTRAPLSETKVTVSDVHAVTGHFTDSSRLQLALLLEGGIAALCAEGPVRDALLILDSERVVASLELIPRPHTCYRLQPAPDTDQDGLTELLLVEPDFWNGIYSVSAEHLAYRNGTMKVIHDLGEVITRPGIVDPGHDLHSLVLHFFTPQNGKKSSTGGLDFERLEGHCSYWVQGVPGMDDGLWACASEDVPWKVVKRGQGTAPPDY